MLFNLSIEFHFYIKIVEEKRFGSTLERNYFNDANDEQKIEVEIKIRVGIFINHGKMMQV